MGFHMKQHYFTPSSAWPHHFFTALKFHNATHSRSIALFGTHVVVNDHLCSNVMELLVNIT